MFRYLFIVFLIDEIILKMVIKWFDWKVYNLLKYVRNINLFKISRNVKYSFSGIINKSIFDLLVFFFI